MGVESPLGVFICYQDGMLKQNTSVFDQILTKFVKNMVKNFSINYNKCYVHIRYY